MATERRTIDGVTQRILSTNIADPVSMAMEALDRVVPYADRIARLLSRLALASAAGAAVIWAVLAEWRWPLSVPEILALGVAALVLLGPAALLLAYRRALLRFAAASDRLRSLSVDIGGQANRMNRAVAGVRAARRDGIAGAVGALRELAAASRAFQDRVDEFAPLVAAGNPTFLAGAVVAAILVPVEVVFAVLLVGWTLLA